MRPLFPCTFPATTEPQAASDPFSARGGQHDSGPFVVQQNSSTAHVVPRSAHARLLRLASASSSRLFSPRLPSAPPFGIPRNRALLCCTFSQKRPVFTTRHDRGPLSSPRRPDPRFVLPAADAVFPPRFCAFVRRAAHKSRRPSSAPRTSARPGRKNAAPFSHRNTFHIFMFLLKKQSLPTIFALRSSCNLSLKDRNFRLLL